MGGYGYGRYVSVAERRMKAQKKINSQKKKGVDMYPVEITGRQISTTFWGKSWCKHLEKFSDYSNRLPRGRSYVRNGAVCDLVISEGRIDAMVCGNSFYVVRIDIKKITDIKWEKIKSRSAGSIGSLLELLEGKISKNVMEIITDRDDGLFPMPAEISLSCNCPDWAVMCKHVSAVLYGVGARLDEKPELIFKLRGVNHEELVISSADSALKAADGKGKRRRIVADDELAGVFGIDIESDVPVVRENDGDGKKKTQSKKDSRKKTISEESSKKKKNLKKKQIKDGKRESADILATLNSGRFTGEAVALLRRKQNMSCSEFAKLLGVSPATIYNWEKSKGALNLRTNSVNALRAILKEKNKT